MVTRIKKGERIRGKRKLCICDEDGTRRNREGQEEEEEERGEESVSRGSPVSLI